MKFAIQSNPHMAGKRTTRGIMLELSGVLGVMMLLAIISNFVTLDVETGVHAIVIFILSIVFSVLGDALWNLSTFWDKKNEKLTVLEKFKLYGFRVLDSYGYVSGLIFALLVPNFTSYYAVIVGAFVGTFLAKCIFGGFGKNVFNPAIAGRVFIGVCFPTKLVSHFVSNVNADVVTGSTILGNLSGNWLTGRFDLSWQQIFLGNRGGAMGEVLIAALIIALIYLIVRNIIDWRLSASYLVTCFITILMIALCSGKGASSFEFAIQHLLVGGILFGAVFCITDPVTSPTSRYGKVIFGILAALITCLIRYQASAPEGVAFSILLCNMVTPLIDRLIKDKSDEHILVKSGVLTGLTAVSLIFGGVYGGLHQEEVKTQYAEQKANLDAVAQKAGKKIESTGKLSVKVKESNAYVLDKKSVKFKGDNKQYLYYELTSGKGYSGEIIFGAIVNNECKVIAYNFIGGNEDNLGLQAAKKIIIDPSAPYTLGGDLRSAGASAAFTFPAVQKALDGALVDAYKEFGIELPKPDASFPKEGTAKEQLKYIWKNELKQSGTLEATEVTVPTFTIENTDIATVESKLNFQFDGKDASFYVVSFTQSNIGGTSDEGKFTAVVNDTGIINFHSIKNQGMTNKVMKPLEKSITVETPYTTEKADDIVVTHATFTSTLMQSAFELIINDFGGTK